MQCSAMSWNSYSKDPAANLCCLVRVLNDMKQFRKRKKKKKITAIALHGTALTLNATQ